ncbi:MAG: AMP-binding protein [Rhodospirillaceae bacterium]|nr:AMP-binding protein [Rhodospirillaceae bacterium]MBT5243372.1 AMP-binding protein [Rhodospirillaceae bacterium]MBT5561277.1 AMP-binding protein [Rhodospirillaceae bacterium]MBT6243352.1 AMP-binding protein [Rhodospirillaceae bacterium]MBT7139028.1 AMP-binding protein [Rhodospirillaceae bacterium]
MTDTTIEHLIAPFEQSAAALNAPDRDPLTYGALNQLVADTILKLNDLGIGRNDPVAIILPNGPEMATAFVAIASAATSAPLNPAYREDELDFYLSDLNARALVIGQGMDSPARAVAAKHGVMIIELVVDEAAPAGSFTLQLEDQTIVPVKTANGGSAQADDVALVLHTSGTTSRPKIVPLSHRNVCTSAINIGKTLALSETDRCLNVMPLFHIHGLIAAVLSSLAAGASIFCTPGFNALKFFGWMDDACPSWYTAVPTMHQTILARAPRNVESLERAELRFVRSSSAALPPQVLLQLEETFGCRVIEAYGMTEAAHQMASNPLEPMDRKPGTVGIAAGPEVGIMDDDGNILAQGDTGEIVIRGDNVTTGYQNNDEANATGFTGGWFRTGDQGNLDAQGYLTITGRLKEIINRGGEKISPREVDEVLLDHPDIAQIVTFAMPHDKLGEEVAAAVVLNEGSEADERSIRDYASSRLADFKVPRKVVILEEIPKGATGKVQRIGLAEKLGLTS